MTAGRWRARWPRAGLLALGMVALAWPLARVTTLWSEARSGEIQVGLVHDAVRSAGGDLVRAAWEAVLVEEGIPHGWLPVRDLLLAPGAETARRFPVLVLPDTLAATLPAGSDTRLTEYVEAGGSVMAVFDPGTRSAAGAYRARGLLADLLGVDYLLYSEQGERTYRQGGVHFDDPSVAWTWQIPPGKLQQGRMLSGYIYGGLSYPIAAARVVAPDVAVAATDGDGGPVLALRRRGRGQLLWVNLPLGYLKAYSDDLPLRALTRAFLLDRVGLPHLLPTPGGVGGLVINWHIDSSAEHQGLPVLIAHGLVRRGLRQDFHVTAGPDRDRAGDGLGFDACGRGQALLQTLAPYGEFGSHGGWAHNWFAASLLDGTLDPPGIEVAIRRNNECLERVSGAPVRAYAAPNGAHPQPAATRVLERLGIRAYYYTGDTGAPPNRTFFAGRMVSARIWAFPVMPNGPHAVLSEMVRAGLPEAEIDRWLRQLTDYVVRFRTIRLLYSHGWDMLDPVSRQMFRRFVDRVVDLAAEGRLHVDTMAGFADFLDRRLLTRFSARRDGHALHLRLRNPQGLHGQSVAVPVAWVGPSLALPVDVHGSRDDLYHVLTIRTSVPELDLRLPLAGP